MEDADLERIERRAGEVLAAVPDWVWDGETLPVPIEEIADTCAGLLVRDIDDMTAAPGCPELGPGQSLSGLLLPSVGEIWVNAEEAKQWPPRRRFTIGHELGHWYLHQQGQTALFCRHGQVDGEDEGAERPPLPTIEEEANYFAAALLMPAEMVRREYARTEGDFEELCRRFSSSGAAMGRRLRRTI